MRFTLHFIILRLLIYVDLLKCHSFFYNISYHLSRNIIGYHGTFTSVIRIVIKAKTYRKNIDRKWKLLNWTESEAYIIMNIHSKSRLASRWRSICNIRDTHFFFLRFVFDLIIRNAIFMLCISIFDLYLLWSCLCQFYSKFENYFILLSHWIKNSIFISLNFIYFTCET